MNIQEAIEKVEHAVAFSLNDIITQQKVDVVYKSEVLDIINQIDELQKAVIPKFVAEWIKDNKSIIGTLYTAYALLSKRKNDVSLWVNSNQDTFARAWLDGYEVEQEKLYIIPLKGLVTTDGHQQYLTGKADKYFASRRNYHLKQTFTQTEVNNNVPACYREWAKPVEE